MASAKVEAKAWDGDGVPLKDSNCAGIGSDEDKAVRKAAAETEPAWANAGQEAGIMVWRIENFKVVPWDACQYGKFHTGDSYIILQTIQVEEKLEHHIFFWLGKETSIDEMGTAAYKTVELDDYFGGEATQSREVQGKESKHFHSLFPKVTYLVGGVDSGFNHVMFSTYQARLFQVRKTAQGMVQLETTLARDAMNEGDSFVLDAGDKIYVYSGPGACPHERYEAVILAKRLADRGLGHCEVSHAFDDRAWRLLGGEGPIPPADEGSDWIPVPDVEDGVLYKLHDTREGLHMDEVGRRKIKREMLDSNHLMILDHETELISGPAASRTRWSGATHSGRRSPS
mmetsp:Transcript_77976/g.226204  ORF Transcript_77976/g.226204 Transcript_77976/m.226204 type:complete len:342 (+) Transcript_77976:121-1146(+)